MKIEMGCDYMPTIKDVAKKANVSVATVSRVINNTGYVNVETRKIVKDAIDDLGYVPNELARSLFNKRSNIIGLIVPHISTYFFACLTAESEKEEKYAYSVNMSGGLTYSSS